jgi:putative phosphoribosyl transferase
MRFRDRRDAGRQLAEKLTKYAGRPDIVVLGLPRGGVPVAYEVARHLNAPLDVFLVRKLGVPGHPELAMGAIAEGGIEVLSRDLILDLQISSRLVEQVAARERLELERREAQYRSGRAPAVVRDRVVILVDDGLATGSTMEAAILALKQRAPARVVVGAPVGARETCERLREIVDEVVCVSMPEPFSAVGQWYEQFAQTTDEEVKQLLAADVTVPVGKYSLSGNLEMSVRPQGIVVFAHGSGSSRHSPRNQYVARALEGRNFATLLIDLLTPLEEAMDDRTAKYRFDIPMLAERLVAIVDWLRSRRETASLPVGLFGASTGAGAALIAAAQRPRQITAVVSRGGRPDLAGAALPHVVAPTLLIVGGLDLPVIEMNRDAAKRMRCEAKLEIVPGATHLFEEAGALERVADLAAEWFGQHLRSMATTSRK